MSHFLDIDKTSPQALRAMVDQARQMKDARHGLPKGTLDHDAPLTGRLIALIFEKPSTRTRVSFDVGARQLGAQTMVLSGKEMQLGHGESIADTARVLSRYVDLIMLRTFEEATLQEMAEHATVPVINGLTDASHPCQIMADIVTYEEHRGPIAGRKFVWSGDGNNVCTSWLHAAGQFGFDLTFTGPPTLDPDPRAVEFARSKGSKVEILRDPLEAARGADAIVTDTWVSMHDPESARERRHNQLRPYQVNAAMMAMGKSDALFMHCLPAHRDEEATSEVMDGPQSVIFDESENRLHAQKAILRWCLG
ncbi:MAG: ornithine carbamoyltransferase, partial [Paracoccaceae bacterium]